MSDFDPDWPHGHVTRDGRPVEKLFRYENTIVALFRDGNGFCSRVYEISGHWNPNRRTTSLDLINAHAPKRRFALWMNIYTNKYDEEVIGGPFKDREEADRYARADVHGGLTRISCRHVTGEEGDGL